MIIADLKDKFVDLCSTIEREGIDDLMDFVNKSDFYTAPASTRYHGSYEGGLLEHSLNTYYCFEKLVKDNNITLKSQDSIKIIPLFHDICKANMYKVSSRNVKENGAWVQKSYYEIEEKFPCGHGEKSVIILQNYIKLNMDEIYSIRAHMGGFDSSPDVVGRIFEKSKLAVLMHIADMEATYIEEAR